MSTCHLSVDCVRGVRCVRYSAQELLVRRRVIPMHCC